MKERLRGFALGAAGVAVAGLYVLASAYGGSTGSTATIDRFAVTGYLTATPDPKFADEPPLSLRGGVFVPGVRVRLRGAGTLAAVQTDLSGRFVFRPRPPGPYKLCWGGPGWIARCVRVRIVDRHVHLHPFQLGFARTADTKIVFGRVRFADGSIPRAVDPLANVNAFAVVRALDASGNATTKPVFVNNDGQYVLPQVPVVGTRRVRASIERELSAAGLTSTPGSSLRRDLTFKNRPPVLVDVPAGRPEGIVARALTSGGRWTVTPGEQVQLTANAFDPNGDRLRYRWILPSGASVLPAVGGRTITHTIPNAQGAFQFTVVAFDGRGGYAKEQISLATTGVLFGGTVVEALGPVLPGAEVEVNGRRTVTGPDGRFVLLVKEADRFVLNIRLAGYALVSRIYDNTVTGGRWELIPASVDTVDPRLPIGVVNKRPPNTCPGALSERRRDQPRRDCGPGIRVSIPPDSLVDAAGNQPAGLVEVELATVDLRAPDSMPGDFSARTLAGTIERMESYGAGTVEIRAGGREYNLRPGASADIAIPIDPDQLTSPTPPPGTIPLLQYDERAGLWVEEGVLNRVGGFYVGSVTHFSALNADLTFSNYACLRVETPLMPSQFVLEATMRPTGAAPKLLKDDIDNSAQRFHTVYRLPTGTPVELRALEPGTNTPIPLIGPGGASVTVLTANSGGLQNPQSPYHPSYPYTACQSSIELTPFRLPPATRDTFLAGLYSFNASNLRELDALDPTQASTVRAAAAAYYQTIDPQGLRTTLAGFRSANGFGAAGGNEYTAQYANAGDLGFGRDMYCRKSGLDVACYVTNYGDRATNNVTDAENAARDHAAPGSATPVATVGMEYTRVENPTGTGFQQATGGGDLRLVKFYVFVHDPANPANTTRAVAADLDGYGPRPVPGLCQVCHGGRAPVATMPGAPGAPIWNTANANSANLGSNFIPFDVISFELPVVTLPNGTTLDLELSQRQAFKDLNQQIVLATSPPQPTVDVINAMYAGGVVKQNTGFVVGGWQGTGVAANQEQTYRQVVAPSCRGCHISQGPSTVNWDQATQFKNSRFFINSIVCAAHQMPHAVETHNRFWLSNPYQPLVLETFLTATNGGTALPNDCTP